MSIHPRRNALTALADLDIPASIAAQLAPADRGSLILVVAGLQTNTETTRSTRPSEADPRPERRRIIFPLSQHQRDGYRFRQPPLRPDGYETNAIYRIRLSAGEEEDEADQDQPVVLSWWQVLLAFDRLNRLRARRTLYQRERLRSDQSHDWGERLRMHYATEPAIRQAYQDAARRFEHAQPDHWAAFRIHVMKATAVSFASVRAFDIISWFRDIPADLAAAVKELQEYYHGEAYLRYWLALGEGQDVEHLEWYGDWTEHDQCAVDRHMKRRYGYERLSLGVAEFEAPKLASPEQGRLVLRQLAAEFDVRVVRVQQALPEERSGGDVKWERSVEGKVVCWIERAVGWLEEPVQEQRTAGKTGEEAARVAFALVVRHDFDDMVVYTSLMKGFKKWEKKLKERKAVVKKLIAVREEIETLRRRMGEGMDAVTLNPMDARRLRDLEAEEEKGVQWMAKECGERCKWDWESQ